MMLRTILIASIVIAAIGLTVAANVLQRSDAMAHIQSGVVLSQPQPLPRFSLSDHHGRPLTRQDLAGRWSLLFSGFTYCPDVCPTTLVELGALEQQLRAGGVALELIFLSVDPVRDTPDVLAPYVEYFSSNMTGITGEMAEIIRLCDALGISFVHIPGAGGEYTVEHSGALVLIDPRARVLAYFRPPFDLERLGEDLSTMIGDRN